MGATVLVLGRSGSGKSTSLRNLFPEDVGLFNVLGKALPFRGSASFPRFERPDYDTIKKALGRNNKRIYVVDDSTYLMQNENFAKAKVSGYQKFTDMAVNFQQLLEAALACDGQTVTYFLHHSERDDRGEERVKTIGKMLDNQYCVEGVFSVVIDCEVRDGRHVFVTENDGTNLVKAPMGSLPPVMDNDLAEVDRLLREYWGLEPVRYRNDEGKVSE